MQQHLHDDTSYDVRILASRSPLQRQPLEYQAQSWNLLASNNLVQLGVGASPDKRSLNGQLLNSVPFAPDHKLLGLTLESKIHLSGTTPNSQSK